MQPQAPLSQQAQRLIDKGIFTVAEIAFMQERQNIETEKEERIKRGRKLLEPQRSQLNQTASSFFSFPELRRKKNFKRKVRKLIKTKNPIVDRSSKLKFDAKCFIIQSKEDDNQNKTNDNEILLLHCTNEGIDLNDIVFEPRNPIFVSDEPILPPL